MRSTGAWSKTVAVGEGTLRRGRTHRCPTRRQCRAAVRGADRSRAGQGRAQVGPAAVHGGREVAGERFLGHRGVPVLSGLGAAPMRRLARAEHAQKVVHDRAVLQRRVVGREIVRRPPRQVFAAHLGDGDDAVRADQQAVGDRQRHEHVGRPRRQLEPVAQRPRTSQGRSSSHENKIEVGDGCRQQVDGVESIPIAVEPRRVGRAGLVHRAATERIAAAAVYVASAAGKDEGRAGSPRALR